MSSPTLADIVSKLDLPSAPLRAVDVGCGTGDDVRWMQEAGFEAMGIDSYPDVLRVAAQQTPVDSGITWVEASATDLPLGDSTCVLVTDRGCLHHLPADERSDYAAEVARVLAPDGAWVIRDVIGHHHQVAELSEDEVSELANGASLRVASCDVVSAGSHTWLVAVLRRD